MTDWDASRYHRVSEPQFDWGQRVIARLKPVAGERILDLGCGTGRLTQEIQRASPGGPPRAVGLDRSGAMLAVARAWMGTAAVTAVQTIETQTVPFADAPETVPVPLVLADGAA